MDIKTFIKTLLPYALECEKETGINAYVILAQAALESGWGRYAPGNMFFGVKDVDGLNGNEQLLLTTEYSTRPNRTAKELGLVDIVSIKPVKVNGKPFFKYKGHSYFRKYDTPKECFVDHAKLFFRASVYAEAIKVKNNPLMFIREMAKHYATDPNYSSSITNLYNKIKSTEV